MKKLKIIIIDVVTQKPFRARIGLVLMGIIVGLYHPWQSSRDFLALSTTGIGVLLGFSTLIYTFMFTLYRIFQQLFKWGNKLPETIRNYDERNLLRIVGFYWFLPFGGTLIIISQATSADETAFGISFMIQGLSMVVASRFSQIVKK